MAKILARFRVAEFNKRQANADGKVATVILNAVTRSGTPDNVDWSKYTPQGTISMVVFETPGGAYEEFEELLGKDVAITFEGIPDGE
jgi:hypothetical protein